MTIGPFFVIMEDERLLNQVNKNTQQIADIATSNAVIARDIGYMRQEVEKLVIKIDELSDQFVTKPELKNLSKRVDEIESNNTWIVRLLIGSIVSAVLAYIGLNK